jgi:UDP-glucose 4-epimerase
MTSTSERGPILIVGGRGFVGAAVVRHVLARGHAVHVLGPASPVPLPAGATETQASIEHGAALDAVMGQVKPRAVASFAAFSAGLVGLSRSGEVDPERMLAVNVLGFRRLLDASVKAGLKRLVWISSTVVLGRAKSMDTRVDETAPREPLINYALSKVLAEDVAAYYRLRHGLETVGLRIPLMMGPGLWYDGAASVLKTLVAEAAPGAEPRVTVPSVPFDAMHVADMGELVEILFAAPPGLAPIYNVAGFTTRWRDIASLLQELVPGYKPVLTRTTPPIVYPLVSQALLERDTGWRHRLDLRATLLDMIAERRAQSS